MHYAPCLHIVLYQPEIPHNAGAVGRTCVAVGAKLWLVRPLGFRIDDYYLRRAGLDYWQHLEWEAVDDWPALTERLPQLTADPRPDSTAHLPPVSSLQPPASSWFFTKKARRTYTQAEFHRGDVFVFGSESAGLPDSLLDATHNRQVRIPVREQVRSLNLSNAVAVSVYEALRQWSVSTAPSLNGH